MIREGPTSVRIRRFSVAAVAIALTLTGASEAVAQSWRTVTSSRQIAGEGRLDVEVTYGAGELAVRPAEQGLLYRMQLRYDEEAFQPRTEYDGTRLVLGLEGLDGEGNVDIDVEEDGAEMALELARDVPMDLLLEFGAVQADIELGGLSLTSLTLRTGASETEVGVSRPNPVSLERARFEVGVADFTVLRLGNLNAAEIDVDAGLGDLTLDFTGEWRRDAEVSVDLGLGSLQLRFPRDLGVRLRKSGLLVALDAEGMVERGDWYYSPGWEDASHRITVEVRGALGDVDVEWVR